MAIKAPLLSVLLLALTLVSCQGKDKKKGTTVSFNIGSEPTTLSPLSSVDMYSASVHSYIFEGLLDRGGDDVDDPPITRVAHPREAFVVPTTPSLRVPPRTR